MSSKCLSFPVAIRIWYRKKLVFWITSAWLDAATKLRLLADWPPCFSWSQICSWGRTAMVCWWQPLNVNKLAKINLCVLAKAGWHFILWPDWYIHKSTVDMPLYIKRLRMLYNSKWAVLYENLLDSAQYKINRPQNLCFKHIEALQHHLFTQQLPHLHLSSCKWMFSWQWRNLSGPGKSRWNTLFGDFYSWKETVVPSSAMACCTFSRRQYVHSYQVRAVLLFYQLN